MMILDNLDCRRPPESHHSGMMDRKYRILKVVIGFQISDPYPVFFRLFTPDPAPVGLKRIVVP